MVCHHIELSDKVDDIWTHLSDGLKDLLITRPTEIAKKQQEAKIEASREGRLAPEVRPLSTSLPLTTPSPD